MDDGLFAEFDTVEGLRRALVVLREQGFRRLDAFTPFPDEIVERAVGPRPAIVTRIAGVAAACGVLVGYGLQWYLNAVDYPLDAGGRPPHSPLAFVPITFETGVLFTALTTFAAVLGLSGLPRLWRPAFEIEGFERTSIDRFWVYVDATDARFDRVRTRALLATLGPLRVVDVTELP
jgi:hypothetical protein